MTAMFDRCPLCPRDRPGLCFAQTRGRSFCGRHAAGDLKRLPLLRGDVEPAAAGTPAPEPPARRRTMADVRAELVRTNAFYCRACATGCQASKCLVGLGRDEYANAPLSYCVACLTGKPVRGV